jgi:hypothetical protein
MSDSLDSSRLAFPLSNEQSLVAALPSLTHPMSYRCVFDTPRLSSSHGDQGDPAPSLTVEQLKKTVGVVVCSSSDLLFGAVCLATATLLSINLSSSHSSLNPLFTEINLTMWLSES